MEHVRYVNGEKRDLTPEESIKLTEKFITNLGFCRMTEQEVKEYEKNKKQDNEKTA